MRVADIGQRLLYLQRRATIRDRFRINNRIRAREVRLIDENGVQVGVVSVREALQIGEERGYDLVEVAPNAVPPVCRLLDYGKFRYEQSKKEREARKNQKQAEIKEVRLRPKTDDHDLTVKANQARRFILSGDKVKFTVRFRGREMAHPDIGREMLEVIAERLRDISVIEQKPLMEGRALSLVLAPNAKVLKAILQAQRTQAVAARQQPSVTTTELVLAPAPEPDDEPLHDEEFADEEFADEELEDEDAEEFDDDADEDAEEFDDDADEDADKKG